MKLFKAIAIKCYSGWILFICLLISNWLFCQQTFLDPNFGTNGIVLASYPDPNPTINLFIRTTALDRKARIVVGGEFQRNNNTDFYITRYLENGKLDSSFAQQGIRTISFFNANEGVSDLAVQEDNKILVLGNAFNPTTNRAEIALVRLNENGSIDSTFNVAGVIRVGFIETSINAEELAIQTDGKIVIGGFYAFGTDILLMRVTPQGILDTSFNHTGIVIKDFGEIESLSGIRISSDNKILAFGRKYAQNNDLLLTRFLSNGTVDSTFGTQGLVQIDVNNNQEDFAEALIVLPDGNLLLGGNTVTSNGTDCVFIKMDANGQRRDSTFRNNGVLLFDIGGISNAVRDMLLQEDGKFIVGQHYFSDTQPTKTVISRFLPNGTLDSSYGNNGNIFLSVGAGEEQLGEIAFDKDENLITAGFYRANIGTRWQLLLAKISKARTTPLQDPVFQEDAFIFYPNPVRNIGYLNYLRQDIVPIDVTLLNGKGQILRKWHFINGLKDAIPIDFSDLVSGSYLIQIKTEHAYPIWKKVVLLR